MRLHLSRTGGFGGLGQAASVDEASLGPAEREELRRLVVEADLWSLPSDLAAPSPAPDRFRYRLTVEDGERRRGDPGERGGPAGRAPVAGALAGAAGAAGAALRRGLVPGERAGPSQDRALRGEARRRLRDGHVALHRAVEAPGRRRRAVRGAEAEPRRAEWSPPGCPMATTHERPPAPAPRCGRSRGRSRSTPGRDRSDERSGTHRPSSSRFPRSTCPQRHRSGRRSRNPSGTHRPTRCMTRR